MSLAWRPNVLIESFCDFSSAIYSGFWPLHANLLFSLSADPLHTYHSIFSHDLPLSFVPSVVTFTMFWHSFVILPFNRSILSYSKRFYKFYSVCPLSCILYFLTSSYSSAFFLIYMGPYFFLLTVFLSNALTAFISPETTVEASAQ